MAKKIAHSKKTSAKLVARKAGTATSAKKKAVSPHVRQQMKRLGPRRKLRTHVEDVIDKKKSPKKAAREAVTEGDTSSNDSASTTSTMTSTTSTMPTDTPLGHGPDTIDFRVPNPFGIVATGTLTDAPEGVPTVQSTMDEEERAEDARIYDEASKDVGLSTGHDDDDLPATQPGNILNIDAAGDEEKK